MSLKNIFELALASSVLVSISTSAHAADAVVSYDPGADYSFGYTNTASVLGAPSLVNPFGDPTDPFDPPYGKNQILSIGEGGSVVLQFAQPVHNHPHNPHGIDFIIFGNTGFIITNEFSLDTYDWVGTPATDGSFFGNNDGITRVSVSADGTNFFQLDPALTPTVDGLYPPFGSGDYHKPVNPALTAGDFAGATLADIQAAYNGAAGGSGYDIAWARDSRGRRVNLGAVYFVRIDVISGKSEIDAVTSVFVPSKKK